MLQIIKLEIKKYKLKKYIKGVFAAIFCIMAFLTMSFVDNKTRTPNDLDTWQSVVLMANVLSTYVFLIFSSALTAKIIIGEYKDRTILVMFSYPVDRKKLIIAKLIIVVVFAATCILISDMLCISYAVILDSIIDVVAGNFSFSYISDAYLIFLGFISAGGVLALLPFAVGMRKKSVPSTVLTAVVVSALMQPVLGGKYATLQGTVVKFIVVALVSFRAAAYTVMKKINSIDSINV